MASHDLHTLTVQDLIWINTQVTKKPQTFDFATLEEATYLQFGYGANGALLERAARLGAGFAKKRPFTIGNDATAFIAMVGFLMINGTTLNLGEEESLAWYQALTHSGDSAKDLVQEKAKVGELHHEGEPKTGTILQSVLDRFPKTIVALLDLDGVARLA